MNLKDMLVDVAKKAVTEKIAEKLGVPAEKKPAEKVPTASEITPKGLLMDLLNLLLKK